MADILLSVYAEFLLYILPFAVITLFVFLYVLCLSVYSNMPLSKKYQYALRKCRFKFVSNLHLGDTLLSYLRTESVLTQEMENQVRVISYNYIIVAEMSN